MRTRRLLYVVTLAALVAWPASAADFWTGVNAYERGELRLAIREWRPLAEAGDVESQYRLGGLYYHARGEFHDDAEALRWYLAAAEQGHALAQNNLGVMYETGRGTDADLAQAARWYLAAAEQGREVAAANVARLYEDGRGVERSEAEAAVWYRRAAEAGHTEAQYRLATLYALGRGVPADDAEAVRWLKRAAQDNHAEAQFALGVMFDAGRGVDTSRSKARKWQTRAATQGVRVAPPEWGGPAAPAVERRVVAPAAASAPDADPAPATGPRVVVERTESPVARIDAEDDVEALHRMGREFEFGLGGSRRDDALAQAAYLRAAELGHGLSAYRLAFLYYRGRGADTRRDFVRAHHWFSVAAEQSVGDAAVWRDRIAGTMSEDELARSEAM